MSKRYFFASSRIEERFGSLDRLLKVWVLDRGRNYQINGSPEERFQGFEKAEVGSGSNSTRKSRSLSPGRSSPIAAEPNNSRRRTRKRRHKASSSARC